ncbi:MAG: triose-phosphate isomerase [Thermoplasmata archaeon]
MIQMKTPVLVINFKSYRESTGRKAVEISKLAEKISRETGIEIAVAPTSVDIVKVREQVSIPVFAQHADPITPGPYTGRINVENLKDWNIDGMIINHSEYQLRISEIDFLVKAGRANGLETIVCTNNIDVTRAVAEFSPDYIAIEPPELIGGDISVSKARPEVVENSVRIVERIDRNIKVLCGAGVKTGEDVKRAMELGSRGILVASGVVKARNIENAIRDLLEGMGEMDG